MQINPFHCTRWHSNIQRFAPLKMHIYDSILHRLVCGHCRYLYIEFIVVFNCNPITWMQNKFSIYKWLRCVYKSILSSSYYTRMNLWLLCYVALSSNRVVKLLHTNKSHTFFSRKFTTFSKCAVYFFLLRN